MTSEPVSTSIVLDDADIERFTTSGFVVLAGVFDGERLAAEVQQSFAEGRREPTRFNDGPGNRFQYVPMMTRRTPASLALIDVLAGPAQRLLGANPLPTRAKGTRYAGATDWHRDSDSTIASIGFLAYLEPLRAETGALRVVPGSHRPPYQDAPPRAAGQPVVTRPGDVIAFDEHLLHASTGGGLRHQWRIDFVAEPVTPTQLAATRAYYAAMFPPDWDGGYDVDAFPSYDADWQGSTKPWTARLAELGAYERAAAQEGPGRS